MFPAARGRDALEERVVLHLKYLLQTNEVIHEEIAPPHLDQGVGTAAEGRTQDLQFRNRLFLGQSTGASNPLYIFAQCLIAQQFCHCNHPKAFFCILPIFLGRIAYRYKLWYHKKY